MYASPATRDEFNQMNRPLVQAWVESILFADSFDSVRSLSFSLFILRRFLDRDGKDVLDAILRLFYLKKFFIELNLRQLSSTQELRDILSLL
jgi:hypothetical protein